jgi:hypothetical protein
MRRFAKPLYGLTPVPRVRIPASPPFPLPRRKSSFHSANIRWNTPNSRNCCAQAGPEKVAGYASNAGSAFLFLRRALQQSGFRDSFKRM